MSRADLSINSTKINLILLKQKSKENSIEFDNQKIAFLNAIRSIYEQLFSNISIWENQYLIKSPVDGIVSFSNIWSKNQHVKMGDKIFAIISELPGSLIGKCQVPISGMGKIKEDQSLIIKLESHPFLEFGTIKGNISSISKIPEEISTELGVIKYVIAEVALPEPLVTSYKKDIPFRGELRGTAEIIIEDFTLMQRFISPLKYIWKKSSSTDY